MGHTLLSAFFQGPCDGVVVPVGLPLAISAMERRMGFLSKVWDAAASAARLDQLVPAVLEGPAAVGVVPVEDSGLLSAEGAGSGS